MSTKPTPHKREQEHQRQAYALYLALGSRRSYQRVADKLGLSPSTIKLWSRTFGWRGRIANQEAESARRIADEAISSGIEETKRNRRIVQMALMKLARGIADDRVKMQMGDLDRLIRLQDELDPWAKKREEISTPEELAEFIRLLADTKPDLLTAALKLIKAGR